MGIKSFRKVELQISTRHPDGDIVRQLEIQVWLLEGGFGWRYRTVLAIGSI